MIDTHSPPMTTPRDSILSIHPSWWPAFFWIFIVQLIWETIMILLDAGPALSDMSLIDRVRFVRAELADDVVISAVFAMLITETWRHIMITTRWLENLVNRNISNYEEKILAEGLTKGRTEGRTEGRAEGRTEGRTEGRAEVLAVLDEDTRKDAERKLEPNGDSDTQD